MSDLFEDTNDGESQPQPISFEDLVGEGKRYRDPDAVAKAVSEKDAFIEQLKKENAEMRTDLSSRMTLEELADKVFKGRDTGNPTEDPRPTQPQEPRVEENRPQIEDLSEQVRKLLMEERAKETRNGNIEKAKSALKEAYGADYKQAVLKAASELGVSEQYLADMSATTPAGFMRLIESVVPRDNNSPTTPPAGSFDSSRGAEPGFKKRNAAYYNELRKSDPKKYFSKEVQVEMYKQAREMGEAFFSN